MAKAYKRPKVTDVRTPKDELAERIRDAILEHKPSAHESAFSRKGNRARQKIKAEIATLKKASNKAKAMKADAKKFMRALISIDAHCTIIFDALVQICTEAINLTTNKYQDHEHRSGVKAVRGRPTNEARRLLVQALAWAHYETQGTTIGFRRRVNPHLKAHGIPLITSPEVKFADDQVIDVLQRRGM